MTTPEHDELIHALRTPLTVIQGFTELLVRKGEQLSARERDEHIRRISAAADEMRALLDAAERSRST